MIVAIIPARGGSKRIKKKNIREFCGQPVIAYSIKQAQASSLFDRIVVSTDDPAIADISRKLGADVPFIRPRSLSGDLVGTVDVINHGITCLEEETNTRVSFACCLYPTAPFVVVDDLREGYLRLVDSKKLFAFSVTTFAFPIQRALKINDKDELQAFWPENIEKRSQDLEEAYHDAGQFYWGKREGFFEKKTILSSASIPIIIPRERVQDIDTEEDWCRAESLYKVLQSMEDH
ncbi:MAG: CMP-N,N'-diacetyllegionaminic acid synthase [Cellvibrionales bacterium UBA7375]|nr:MAG: CMP-N,N'-diacetyllegionaminic acid synthase [Cellvibrionales bacterium UBA7375]